MKNLIIIIATTIFFAVNAKAQTSSVVALSGNNAVIENSSLNNSSVESCSSVEEAMSSKVFKTTYSVNKFTKSLKLNMTAPVANYAIVNIIDVMGRKVFSARMNVAQGLSTKELNLSNYAKGLYNLQVITDSSIKNFRIVI